MGRALCVMSCVMLSVTNAAADLMVRPPTATSSPWTERCAARLEAKRREWARDDPDFADAYVTVHKVNGGDDAVALRTIDNFRRQTGFWIEVYDHPVHVRADADMQGFAQWEPMKTRQPLSYPVILRHIHPRSARMQPEPWVSLLRWEAFVQAFRPLVDACLRD